MRRLTRQASVVLALLCLIFVLAISSVALAGIQGVRSTSAAARAITRDELATTQVTARVEQLIGTVYATSQQLLLTPDPARRPALARTLYDQAMPAADVGIAELQRVHAADPPAEQAAVTAFAAHWVSLRTILNQLPALGLDQPRPRQAAEVATAADTLSADLGTFLAREKDDAGTGETRAAAISRRTTAVLVLILVLTVLAVLGLGLLALRRLRAAAQPAEHQAEFVESLQQAEHEVEAHELLKKHLERSVAGRTATVLNRNNSADRLEAVTPLAAGSGLVAGLEYARPRSCLAVRSGRAHVDRPDGGGLLTCSVCSHEAGTSLCSPLTVGGSVIGSVLVTGQGDFRAQDEQQIRDAVAQAAPVLANLRNLAIAEVRAATDSLTGLPNKRAIGDTLKRMLAQSSRDMVPLSLLMLDLDHFKNINDRFGHPVGDQALANVGAALRSALRASDFAGRYGGEEFAVILPSTGADGARTAAGSIRAAISAISLPGVDIRLTASIGVAVYPEHATDAERLERRADAALYLAKRSGRDRTEVVGSDADQTAPASTS